MTGKPDDYRELLSKATATIADLRGRVAELERRESEPIAIVGMACRLPGQADTPEEFWDVLTDGRDNRVDIPIDRWDHKMIFHEDRDVPGKIYVRQAALLDRVDEFDPMFFGISPREAGFMDPQQRLLLQCTWEALERAGSIPEDLRGTNTGVFVGSCFQDYRDQELRMADASSIDVYSATGSAPAVLSGRVSYLFGFEGPCLTVDTACSSSLMAAHLACQSLRKGECDTAVSCGTNLIIDPAGMLGLATAQMLAPDGRSKAFDASADGYGRGEGIGVVVLKRLSDAEAAGDRILGVILGSATNQDGASKGLTVPSMSAQEAAIVAALDNAGVDDIDVSYVEAHGTGTPIGDPIEVSAIGGAFSGLKDVGRRLAIGSVKTNIGHLEGAAGIAGLMKVILAIQNKAIPGHPTLETPSPDIEWDDFAIDVPTELTPWEPAAGGRRIAGINSFGFGGSNVHMIVAEPPDAKPSELQADAPARQQQLISLSARVGSALPEVAATYAEFLKTTDQPAADVAHASRTARSRHRERLVVTAPDNQTASARLTQWLETGTAPGVATGTASANPPLAFLFTGQGAQYPNMGRDLYATEAVFREAMDSCAAVLDEHLEVPLLTVMFPSETDDDTLINNTTYTQPALFAFEYSLAQLWRSWGVEPSILMGHSVGEYAAACCAGVFSLADGLKLIAARGRLMGNLPDGGSMAAVRAGIDAVKPHVETRLGEVSIAALNGPMSTVISGAADAVEEVAAALAKDGVDVTVLSVSHAFHSPLMEPVLEDFRAVAETVTFTMPSRFLISNVTGKLAGHEVTTADYWVRHVREPVQFRSAMVALDEEGYEHFLEIGPQPTLLGMGRGCVPSGQGTWVPSIRKGHDESEAMVSAAGALHIAGSDLDWQSFDGGRRPWAELPTYPFRRDRYWHELADNARGGEWSGAILGARVPSPLVDGATFRTPLGIASPEHLTDHRIFDYPVFPAAGFIEMAFEAGQLELGVERMGLKDISIREALVLPEEGSVEVQAVTDHNIDGGVSVEAYSEQQGQWRKHFSATVVRTDGPPQPELDIAAIQARCEIHQTGAEYYQTLHDDGYTYGPGYQASQEIWLSRDESLARIELPDALQRPLAIPHLIHPSLFDALLQGIGRIMMEHDIPGDSLYLPVFCSGVHLWNPHRSVGWAHCRLTEVLDEVIKADATLYADDGSVIASIDQFIGKKAERSAVRKAARTNYDSWLYDVAWPQRALFSDATTAESEPGRWLVFGDDAATTDSTARMLGLGGHEVTTVVPNVSGADLNGQAPPNIDDAEALSRWLADYLDASDAPYRGAICLWGLGVPDAQQHAAIIEQQREVIGRPLTLIKALTSVGRQQLNATNGPRLVLVSSGGQDVPGTSVTSPIATSLWGLGRTAATEHPELRVVCVDIENGMELSDVLAAELAADENESQVAWRATGRHVARLQLTTGPTLALPDDESAYALRATDRGTLDNLSIDAIERTNPGAGEVEIKVRAGGLNFRDVLNVLGMYPGDPGEVGVECAGTISAVGPDVTDWAVGDDVITVASGTFQTHLVIGSEHVHAKPTNLSFAEAATVPVTFLTAFYGLHELAKMKAGDRVLIHAASGGVGMAAMQLAKQAGAEIFGTAGAQWKKDLVRSLGADHVLHSRSLDFADEIMEITDGAGVNIVLNSLADDFIPKSLGVLADNGSFLEIGKRGIWTEEQVAGLNGSLGYYPFDLLDVIQNQPELIRSMMDSILAGLESGVLTPLPVQAWPVQEAVGAFRHMQQAKHIGKIIITMSHQDIDPDGTYLVTGGVGGLGREITRWLADRGARHIVSTSRRGLTEDIEPFVEELKDAGVDLRVLAADISLDDDVDQLFATIAGDMPPLRGVFHAAGVLDDGALLNQSWDRFETVLAPKVSGGWELHRRTRSMGLDHFVLFSSISGVIGNPGQANYAVANTWLDGLASLRRSQGLAAVSINWGPWASVGMAAETPQAILDAAGLMMMEPDEATEAMSQVLASGSSQTGIAAMDWSRMRHRVQHLPFFELAIPADTGAARSTARGGDSEIRQLLATAPVRERGSVMLDFVGRQLGQVLGLDPSQDLDYQLGLFDLGMDSLTAIEFGNLLEQSFGQAFPQTLAFEAPTIEAMADHLLELIELPDDDAGDTDADETDTIDEAAQEVAGLDDEEALEQLLGELGTASLGEGPS